VFALAFLVAFSPSAFAAEKEEVMLKDGLTAMVEVLETGPQSVTVSFVTKEGVKGQTRLHANALDVYSFYEIRRRHMEQTAENHVKLAIFCASNGLFKRAKRQMDEARAIDPEIDTKIENLPDVMEGIADHLVAAARRHYRAGDLELAYDIASLIATRFPETKGGELARSVLKDLEAEVQAQAERKEEEREAAIQAEKDAAKKKAAQKREKVLAPLEKSLNAGHRAVSMALQQRNQSRAKRAYEAAAQEFTKLLDRIDKAMKTDDAELVEQLTEMDLTVRKEAVRAWIHAGNVALSRGSRPEAMKYAQAAVAVDPDSSAAKSFMNSVQLASAMSGWGRWR
jgi:tetratricopeptide (TPR) repeat protein